MPPPKAFKSGRGPPFDFLGLSLPGIWGEAGFQLLKAWRGPLSPHGGGYWPHFAPREGNPGKTLQAPQGPRAATLAQHLGTAPVTSRKGAGPRCHFHFLFQTHPGRPRASSPAALQPRCPPS